MPPKRARAEEDVQAKETMMDIVEKRGEFDRMTKKLSRIREDIYIRRRLFEKANEKQIARDRASEKKYKKGPDRSNQTK